ncbi:MAG: NitT/TauT family transport system permease protein [Halobacteriales archaeon]|jgi:NitT/TauT family transport system permease protein
MSIRMKDVADYPPDRLAKRGASIAAVFVVWGVITAVGVPTLPSPRAVADQLVALLGTPGYWSAVTVSLTRVYLAFAMAVLTAVPLGILMGWSQPFADLTFPSFEMLRPIPPIAWLPASILIMPTLTVWFGVGSVEIKTNVIFITLLGAFFPILLNTIDGMQDVETEFPRAAKSLGAERLQVFRHVYLPASLPAIHTGMVVGMGLAWVNLVAAEMLAGSGLGYLTWSSYTAGNYATIIVGMISIGVLGYLSSSIVRYLGSRYLGWQSDSDE